MLIYGKQPVFYVAKLFPQMLEEVYVSKELDKQNFKILAKTKAPIRKIDSSIANKMAKSNNHQNLLARIKDFELKKPNLKNSNKIVVLVGVTDTGNIGNIIRSSYALGFDGVIVCGIKSFNIEGAIKASSGAIFSQFVDIYQNSYDLINKLKLENFFLAGASVQEKSKEDIKAKKIALFLGSEGSGLPNRVVQKMDILTTIKMKNNFDSLNVANAAAILMDRVVNRMCL